MRPAITKEAARGVDSSFRINMQQQHCNVVVLRFELLASFHAEHQAQQHYCAEALWLGRTTTWSKKDQHAAIGSGKDSHPLFASLG